MKYHYFIPLLITAFLPSLIYKKLKTMNINNYVKKFGKYDFKQLPFNEVDALILCTAIYSNLEVISSSINDKDSKAFYFKNISNFDIDVITAGKTLLSGNKDLIPLLRISKRYSNIGIKYLQKVFYPDYPNQFYACTFIIPNVGNFIAFRGTDSSIGSWEENLYLGFKKVTLSQLNAVKYLNTASKYIKGPLYVGGHSKGGNLSLYSVIHADIEVQNRIIKGYSFDGNGLSDENYLSSKEYLRIKDKFILVSPYNSLISELLTNPKERIYVKAKGLITFQKHNPHCWKLDKHKGKFVTVNDKSKKSYIIHETFKKWINELTDDQKILIIKYVTTAFGEPRKTIFQFIFDIRNIKHLIQNHKKYSKNQKKNLGAAIGLFRKSYKDAKGKTYNKPIHEV